MRCAKKCELAAQEIDRQQLGRDGVVADLGIRKARRNLRAPRDVPVLRMAKQERRNTRLTTPRCHVTVHRGRVATRRQGLLIRLDWLFETFPETRFKFLFRHVPNPSGAIRICPVDVDRPPVNVLNNRLQLVEPHRTIDGKARMFDRCHALGQLIDERAVGLQQQRDKLLLPLNGQMIFSPSVEPIPGIGVRQCAAFQVRVEAFQIASQHTDLAHLQKMF